MQHNSLAGTQDAGVMLQKHMQSWCCHGSMWLAGHNQRAAPAACIYGRVVWAPPTQARHTAT